MSTTKPSVPPGPERPYNCVSSHADWRQLFLQPAFIPTVVFLGLLVRLLVAVFLPVEPMSDSAWYVARAIELASGLGYQEGGFPTAYWPVGWPAILAGGYWLVGSMPPVVIALNLVSALAILLLIPRVAYELTGNPMVGRIAILAYAAYPNHIAYSSDAATEIFYTALATGAFALVVIGRRRDLPLIVGGFIFGVATLVKPQTIAFPFGVAIALTLVYRSFSWRSFVRHMLLVYVGLLLVISPWTYRNFVVFGEPVMVSTNGGTALLLGANDQITGAHFGYEHTPVYQQFGIPWEDRVRRQVELNALQKKAAIDWIRENPASYAAWMPRKVLMLWLKDTDGFWDYTSTYHDSTLVVRGFQVANQIYYAAILLLALACFVYATIGLLRMREDRAKLGLLFCMPVFVSLIGAVFTGQIRYHFPAMPFLFIAAAWTLCRLMDKRSRPWQ